MFSIDWENLNKAIAQLGKYVDDVEKALGKALFQEGEELMAEAKILTPVDEGVLRSSGFVTLPFVDENNDTVVDVGFGGPAGSGNHGGETNPDDVGYALIQHEDLTLNHTVGQAKFLEVPLNERKSGYSKRLAKRISNNIKII